MKQIVASGVFNEGVLRVGCLVHDKDGGLRVVRKLFLYASPQREMELVSSLVLDTVCREFIYYTLEDGVLYSYRSRPITPALYGCLGRLTMTRSVLDRAIQYVAIFTDVQRAYMQNDLNMLAHISSIPPVIISTRKVTGKIPRSGLPYGELNIFDLAFSIYKEKEVVK
jgi:hypothetical protein